MVQWDQMASHQGMRMAVFVQKMFQTLGLELETREDFAREAVDTAVKQPVQHLMLF